MDSITVQTSAAADEKVCLLPSHLSKQAPQLEPQLTQSQDSEERSPFILLPAEIRNKIYRYSLVEDPSADRIRGLVQPPLTRTNNQIRSEALPIYYGENRFYLIIPASMHNNRHPDDWPNFIRMFRVFKAGRTDGRGTGSLRFIRNIQCRLYEAIHYDCWHMWVTFEVFSEQEQGKGIVECAEDRDGLGVAERGVLYFWRDLASIRRFFDCELVKDNEFPGMDLDEESLHRLVTSALMMARECIQLTKGVQGFVWAAVDQRWPQNE